MLAVMTDTSARLVLVVEDHDDTRAQYAVWLSIHGFRVAQAATGEEALRHAQTEKPDLVMLDMFLRGRVDGFQVTQKLKAIVGITIPVIAVTGLSSADDLERASNAGCDVVLVKPCPPQTLLSEIRRLLSLSPANEVSA
jgi:DNA-binding response OmpR family regulator